MSELVELYESTSIFHNDVNEYVKNSCKIIESLENTIILENEMISNNTNEIQSDELNDAVANKIDVIFDKASNQVKAERLVKTIKKTVDRVKRIETIVPVIGKAKVHIVNVWSFKKYIDSELDKLLKTGRVEDVIGKNPFSSKAKTIKFGLLQDKMHDTAKQLRIPAKIKLDKNGNISEDKIRLDNTRQSLLTSLTDISIGAILNFVTKSAGDGAFLKDGIEAGLISGNYMDAIKRKMSGTWGEPYETVTIDELYKRIKELDPEHFATIADNEIEAIRKEFTRSKKMKRLGKINKDSSTKAIKLAGDIVNTQADYINFRQTIANYYIKIIDRSFAILRKGVNSNNKKASTIKESTITTEASIPLLTKFINNAKKSLSNAKETYDVKKKEIVKNKIGEIDTMMRTATPEVKSTILVIPDLNKLDSDIMTIINYRLSQTDIKTDDQILPDIKVLVKTTNRLEDMARNLNSTDVDYNDLDRYSNSIYRNNNDVDNIKKNVLYYPTSRYHYHGDLPYYPSRYAYKNRTTSFYFDPNYSSPGFPRHDKIEPEEITVENLYKRWKAGTTDENYHAIMKGIEKAFSKILEGSSIEQYIELNRKPTDKLTDVAYALYDLGVKYNTFSLSRYNYYCKVLYRVLAHEK